MLKYTTTSNFLLQLARHVDHDCPKAIVCCDFMAVGCNEKASIFVNFPLKSSYTDFTCILNTLQ